MRIFHGADIHCRKDRAEEVFAAFDTIEREHARKPFDLFAFAGDFWDGPVQNTAGSLFMAFVDRVRRLADLAPVVLIEGTPTHDAPGSLDVLETVMARCPIVILRPGVKYFLNRIGGIHSGQFNGSGDIAILFGVPEPNKKWLLAEQGATGKEAADKAFRDSLKALFLGLGGLRKQHSELPCVLLYHGPVAGAKSATSYKAEAGTGLVVSRDDLAAVGADYIGLGHIHQPQQIKDLPAYYPGSFYPIDFGETHKAGGNVVEIEHQDGIKGQDPLFDQKACARATVSRLEFPIPQRVKLTTKWPDGADAFDQKADIQGKVVWIETTVTKETAASFDQEVSLARLLSLGALPGSRVTLNVLPSEMVRAAEIVDKKSLAEKVQVWAENAGVTLDPGVLAKAQELESRLHAVSWKDGAIIRIDSLRLRGAKGIWKNQRKDEVFIDLSKFDPGVIAFIGSNGMGKTTILENMHPWPSLLTRTGTLKSHFRLRDSCRELHFTDLRTNWKYRALIEINAATASGGAEYWLHIDKGTGFEPLPGISGRLADYEEAIGELFGSLEMYLRTAFVTQRPTSTAPDLADSTKGQRKALFAELSGIDYLETHKLNAKEIADELERDVTALDYQIDAAERVVETLADKRRELAEKTDEIQAAMDMLVKIQQKGQAANQHHENAARAERTASEQLQEVARAIQDHSKAENEITGLLADLDRYRLAEERRPAAEATLREFDALSKRYEALLKEKAVTDQANHEALRDYSDKARAFRAKLDGARRELEDAQRLLSGRQQRAAIILAGLNAEIQDHCPTCGQLLPEDKRAHLIAERDRKAAEYETAKAAVLEHNEIVNTLADKVRQISAEAPQEPELIPFAKEEELSEVKSDLLFMESQASQARQIITEAQAAAVRSEESRKRIEDKKTVVKALAPIVASRQDKQAILQDAQATLTTAREDLERIRKEFQDAMSKKSAAIASVEMLTRAITEAEGIAAKAETARKDRAGKARELEQWRILERACGPDGIQALELDALAPSIAAMTNKLLQSSYGERYQVRFDTTRIGGKGAKAKQIEDFLIFIQDAETGEEQEIGTLSGGESVWIRKSIYDAFAIIRAKNTGIQFQTVFLDEADGALDPPARMQYLRMLEAAHEESHRHHTIVITHSTELQSMIGQSIDVTALGPKEATL